MGILLAFAPFIAFAIADRLLGSTEGLVVEIGTALLFAGLALYALAASPASVIEVRLWVDAGLLLIVLVSMALGRPFTLQYAREQVGPEAQGSPAFLRTNYVITAAWALAFAVMVAAEFALLSVPEMSHRAGVVVIILALVGAVKFTGWYPAYVQRGSGP